MAHLDKLSTKELEDILCQLCTEENIKVAVSGDDDSKKGLAKSAGSAIGGKMLNKVGLGGFGSLLSGGGSKDSGKESSAAETRPAADVIRELPPDDKDKLADTVQKTMSGVGFKDFADPQALWSFISNNAMVKQLLTTAITGFLNNFLKAGGGGAA